jgi:GntR family transcriptional regulator of arabinose operon
MISDHAVFWYTTESRDRIFNQELISKLSECSAVVCYNDEIAFRLIPLLQSTGLNVPQDISVVSFDNSTLSEISPVKITSLSYGDQNIGHVSAQKLMRLIAGEPAETETLRWQLVEKESSR